MRGKAELVVITRAVFASVHLHLQVVQHSLKTSKVIIDKWYETRGICYQTEASVVLACNTLVGKHQASGHQAHGAHCTCINYIYPSGAHLFKKMSSRYLTSYRCRGWGCSWRRSSPHRCWCWLLKVLVHVEVTMRSRRHSSILQHGITNVPCNQRG